MYDYRPPRKNGRARLTVLLLLIASALSLLASTLIPKIALPLQCAGLLLLVPVAQVAARYLLLQYLYRVRSREDDAADLEIYTYRGGDRMQLVCRVALSELVAMHPLTRENRKPPRGIRRFFYAPDMSPSDGVVLSVLNGDGASEVLITPDETLRAILQHAIETYHPGSNAENT